MDQAAADRTSRDLPRLTRREVVRAGLLLAALPLLAAFAHAQDYPTRPVRWISPWPPGGANDVFSRAIAQELTKSLGQPVVVENRPGAAGTIGSDAAAKAAGDGYTVVMGSSPTHAIAPSVSPRCC